MKCKAMYFKISTHTTGMMFLSEEGFVLYIVILYKGIQHMETVKLELSNIETVEQLDAILDDELTKALIGFKDFDYSNSFNDIMQVSEIAISKIKSR
ncbi:MAG: hypothetical protein ACRC5M_02760 [Anaeroplasmataceae bacterium]